MRPPGHELDLRLLEVFCHVYEERSFSRAADKLRLRQPTVSSHIASLERLVGSPLFLRTGRTIRPTRLAEILHEHGRQILELKRTAAAEVDRFLGRVEGELTVGGSTIPGEYILPPLIAAFRAEHPAVAITLRIADTRAILGQLEEGAVEAGFVGARVPSPDLQFRKFACDELVLVAPNTAPWRARRRIDLERLREEPLVLREPGSGTRAVFEQHLRAAGCAFGDLRVIAEVGSTNAAKEAVKAGIGLTVLSSRAIELELRAGALVSVAVRGLPRLGRDFYAVTTRRSRVSFACEAFLGYVLEHARAAPRSRKQGSYGRTALR